MLGFPGASSACTPSSTRLQLSSPLAKAISSPFDAADIPSLFTYEPLHLNVLSCANATNAAA